jgi:PAS domain S-box-containing protein
LQLLRRISRLETELRDRERESLLVMDYIPAAITYIDVKGCYRFVNKLAAKWLGLPASSVIGHSIKSLMGTAGHEGLQEFIVKVQAGEVQRFDGTTAFPDGITRDIDRSFVPDFDPSGKVIGFFVLAIDITERTRAERLLAESEQRLKEAIGTIPGGFVLYARDGKLILWNKQYSDFYPKLAEVLKPGTRLEDIARFAFKRGVIRGTWKNMDEWMRIRMQTYLYGEPTTYEQHLGDGRWLLCQDIRTKSGLTVGIRTDITTLKENEERLKQATDLAKIGHWVWDTLTKQYLYCSAEFARIHGESVDDFLRHAAKDGGVLKYTHRDDLDAYRLAVQALNAGQDLDMEYRIVTRDGETRYVHEIARPIREEGGRIVRQIGTIQDVTTMKLAEERLRQAQRMEVVGQITGGVAHDFNNLLGIIIGNLDFLEEGLQDDETLHSMVESATDAALRAAELTRHLLAFARQQPLMPRVADVNALIGAMDGLLRQTVGTTAAIDWKPAAGVWPVRIDVVQLESALLNFAVNASHAMKETGGMLTISTQNVDLDQGAHVGSADELAPGHYVAIQVTDTGCGMTKEVRDRAFEPFFTTKKLGEGSGLGLSMAHGFAKQSGGMVEIRSAVGSGTTITLYLPALDTLTDTAQAPHPD